jgi:hypothetical protein
MSRHTRATTVVSHPPEENETYLASGDSILLHSDGLAEAHNPAGEMFGFPRLQKVVENSSGGERLIKECLAELKKSSSGATGSRRTTSPSWRSRGIGGRAMGGPRRPFGSDSGGGKDACRILAYFSLPSEPGNEREAMELVAEAVQGLGLPPARLETLVSTVGERFMVPRFSYYLAAV